MRLQETRNKSPHRQRKFVAIQFTDNDCGRHTLTWRSDYCDSNKGECCLNQSKDGSFVKRVAKNNS